jgi:hypothetical protein
MEFTSEARVTQLNISVACPGFGVASAKQPHDPHGPA